MAISASTWKRVDGGIGLNQLIEDTSTTQREEIGKIVSCKDVGTTARGYGKFIYLVGVASTAAGDCVMYNPVTGATVRTIAATIGPVGIAMSANVANQYGWYQIEGAAVCTAATVLALGLVYTTATDGTIDDTGATANQILGAQFIVATDTGKAVVLLNPGGAQAGAADAII